MDYTIKTSLRPENENVVFRLFAERWNENTMKEICSAGYTLTTSGATLDIDEAAQFMGMLNNALPDMKYVIEDIVSAGDIVSFRATANGTNTGSYLSTAPTGSAVSFTFIHMSRVDKGKIIQSWEERDTLTLMRCMGLFKES